MTYPGGKETSKLSHRPPLPQAESSAGGRYARVVATYARPTRLVRGKAIPDVDVVEALFAQKEETDLFDAVEQVEERVRVLLS